MPPAGNEWEGRNQNTCTDAVSIMYGNIKGWVLLSAIRKLIALCTCLHVFPVPFLPPLPSYLTKVHNPPLLKMFSLFFPGFCAAALRVLPNPTKGEHYLLRMSCGCSLRFPCCCSATQPPFLEATHARFVFALGFVISVAASHSVFTEGGNHQIFFLPHFLSFIFTYFASVWEFRP